MERGNIKNLGLPEVRWGDGCVMRDLSFERGDGWEDRGVFKEMPDVGDRKKSWVVGL